MNAQAAVIEVDQMTAVLLKAQAEAKGVTVSEWLGSLVEVNPKASRPSFFETASPEERARAVEEWANVHRSTAPPLSDQAISRDSIYGEREENQL